MTKKEIVKTISEEIGLTQLKTKEIVQKTFDAIVETLVEDGRIELRNFGVFEVKKRAARKASTSPIASPAIRSASSIPTRTSPSSSTSPSTRSTRPSRDARNSSKNTRFL